MTTTNKHEIFKIGDKFTVPTVRAGHESHKASDVFEVLQIIKGETPQTTHYRVAMQGPVQWWPHSRCKAVHGKNRTMSTNKDKLDFEIHKMFADAKPLTQTELKSFGEKNREIMEHPSFKAGVIEDQFFSDEQLAKALFFACSDMFCHKDAQIEKPYSWKDYLPCVPSFKEYLLIHQFTKQKTHKQTS